MGERKQLGEPWQLGLDSGEGRTLWELALARVASGESKSLATALAWADRQLEAVGEGVGVREKETGQQGREGGVTWVEKTDQFLVVDSELRRMTVTKRTWKE